MRFLTLSLLLAFASPLAAGQPSRARTDSSAAKPAAAKPSDTPTLSAAQLRAAVRSALRRSAASKDLEHEPAVRELIRWYGDLAHDTKLGRDERWQLRAVVRERLLRISNQIARRSARLAKESVRRAPDENVVAQEQAMARVGEPLAQVFGLPRPAAVVPPVIAGGFGQAPKRGPADHGQELVELIQATIAPTTWDINGGNGTIFYFHPRRVLVVRQTGEVHDQLHNLIKDLGK